MENTELPVITLPDYWIHSNEIFSLRDFNTKSKGIREIRSIGKSFSENVSAAINKIANKDFKSASTISMSLFSYLLTRYADNQEILFYTEAFKGDSKTREELYPILIKPEIEDHFTVKELIVRFKDNLINAYQFQDHFKRLHRFNPIISNVFFYASEIDEIPETLPAEFDICVNIFRNENAWGIHASFNRDIFLESFIDQLLAHFNNLMGGLANVDKPLKEINFCNTEERNTLVNPFHTAPINDTDQFTLVSLWEQQVAKTPNTCAIIFRNKHYSYSEINALANQLANYLKEQFSVTVNDRIVLLLRKSQLSVVAMLGVMKAGATYIPVDGDYTDQRLNYILKDIQPTALIIESAYMFRVSEIDNPIFVIDFEIESLESDTNNPAVPLKGSDLAYIIYTSGTTGEPKGVMVEHRGVVNTLSWRSKYYSFSGDDSTLQIPSIAFDSSVEDIFTVLISGGQLVIPDPDKFSNIQYLIDLMIQHRVSNILVVPSFYKVLIKAIPTNLESLRFVTVAGEETVDTLVNEHYEKLPYVNLVNEYGPTENSICSTVKVLVKGQTVTIGKPISNVQTFILDRNRQLQPIGVVGQIYLSGAGLSRGYWNKEELNKSKFVTLDYAKGSRVYKTGDFGYYDSEGNICFIGRKDDQIKLNGFRIELNEIIAALTRCEGVNDCVVSVIKDKDDGKCLVAYVVATGTGRVTEAELRTFLLKELPYYMIPHFFIFIDKIPLTINGKADKGALPSPFTQRESFTQPENELERQILSVWSKILKREVGVTEKFFSAGGDSIKAIMITYELSNLGYAIDPKFIFEYETVRGFAKYIEESQENNKFDSTTVKPSVDMIQSLPDANLPLHQFSMVYPCSWVQKYVIKKYDDDNHHCSGVFHPAIWWSFTDNQLNKYALENAINHAIAKHEQLRSFFYINSTDHQIFVLTKEKMVVPLQYIDLRHLDSYTSETYIKDHVWKDIKNRFRINQVDEPLVRFYLFAKSENTYSFMVTCHHAIIDGWSRVELQKDIHTFYTQLCQGITPIYTSPPPYQELVQLEVKEIQSGRSIDFWSGSTNTISELDNPKDIESYSTSIMELGPEFSVRVDAISRDRNLSPKAICLSTFLHCLQQLNIQETVIGVVTNRRVGKLSDPFTRVGLYWNILPFECKEDNESGINLQAIQWRLNEINEHCLTPIASMHYLQHKKEIFNQCFNFIQFHNEEAEGKLFPNDTPSIALQGLDIFPYELTFSLTYCEKSTLVVGYKCPHYSESDIKNLSDTFVKYIANF